MTQAWSINGSLKVEPASQHTDRLAEPVAKALPEGAGFAAIDPNLADTAEFCATYGPPLSASANCVIVAAKRGGEISYAACMALGTTRVNVNSVVRKHLGARKTSFAPMDDAVKLSGMEYGGITPIGLPSDWPILIDSQVAAATELIVGSGVRDAKLLVTGTMLEALPGTEIIEGLAS